MVPGSGFTLFRGIAVDKADRIGSGQNANALQETFAEGFHECAVHLQFLSFIITKYKRKRP